MVKETQLKSTRADDVDAGAEDTINRIRSELEQYRYLFTLPRTFTVHFSLLEFPDRFTNLGKVTLEQMWFTQDYSRWWRAMVDKVEPVQKGGQGD